MRGTIGVPQTLRRRLGGNGVSVQQNRALRARYTPTRSVRATRSLTRVSKALRKYQRLAYTAPAKISARRQTTASAEQSGTILLSSADAGCVPREADLAPVRIAGEHQNSV